MQHVSLSSDEPAYWNFGYVLKLYYHTSCLYFRNLHIITFMRCNIFAHTISSQLTSQVSQIYRIFAKSGTPEKNHVFFFHSKSLQIDTFPLTNKILQSFNLIY